MIHIKYLFNIAIESYVKSNIQNIWDDKLRTRLLIFHIAHIISLIF